MASLWRGDTVVAATERQVEVKDLAASLMARLRGDQRRVVGMRYWEGKRTADIAAELGLTPQRIGQIHDEAIAAMKRLSAEEKIA
jgi:DNA-directed RNA polymerase specialized sigma subunit